MLHMLRLPGLLFLAAVLPLLISGQVQAQQMLYLSSSSQIAEAFGKEVIEKFEDRYETKVSLHIGSSETALLRLENDFSDLACIAFRLPREYREKGYVDIPFAQDPLVVVTHEDNPVEDLSPRQLRNIFMQNLTNWKELEGEDTQIVTFVPRRETALRQNFQRQVMQGFDISYDYMSYISTRSVTGVKHIPGAITFASLGAVEGMKDIRTLSIDGHDPKDEQYPFIQTFSFVSKGEPGSTARGFIDAALSARGQDIIREKGMEPVME